MEAIEEINKAKAMLKDGLITKDEFEILKAEIISKLGNSSINEDIEPSNSKINQKKKGIKKEAQDRTLKSLSNEKTAPIIKSSTQASSKDQTKSKQVKEKLELLSRSQGISKKEVPSDTEPKQTVKTNKKIDSYKVKRTLFIFGLIIIVIISFTIDPENRMLVGLFGGMIAMAWWAFKMGKRSLFFFYAPYILFTISFIQFIYGSYYSGDKKPDDKEAITILIWIFSIIEFLAFLFEYFLAQPKCSYCGKRSGMRKIADSDYSSYDYIGTKTYDIRSKGGEKIGDYEGPVSRTAYNFTAQYQCKYCKNFTSRRESEHYDN